MVPSAAPFSPGREGPGETGACRLGPPVSVELFLDVVFTINVETSFQYRCPPELVPRARPGMRVLAPLRGRVKPGLIVSVGSVPKVSRLLSVTAIPDPEPLLDAGFMAFVRLIADRMLVPEGLALRAAVPARVLAAGLSLASAQPETRLFAALLPSGAGSGGRPLTPRQRLVLHTLETEGEMSASDLTRRSGADYRTMRLLEGRGFISLIERPREEPKTATSIHREPPPALTPTQEDGLRVIGEALSDGAFRRLILHAPPGSGKMEISLRALERHLPAGKQALILVPELSLTPPLESRLEALFPGQVMVWHGRLPEAERLRRWIRMRMGEPRIVLGSRSAVFAPVPSLGLIIVDEEQEPSYKSEESPRYHARDAAVDRARLLGIPVILSSAAPSLETLAVREAPESRYVRPGPGPAAGVKMDMVDLGKDRLPRGEVLSGTLRFALKDCLVRKGRALLFVNRRGFAAAASCADCFYTQKCPRCSTVLAYQDEREGTLACRLCGHREPLFVTCPRCGGAAVRPGSPGTRGIEKEMARLFPEARTAVLDRETAAPKGGTEKVIADFAQGRVDVLIGTQLAARGLDWPGVSLVGVIDADAGLARPDFRAAERAFQLLTQVSGLAGRGKGRGRVVIQTRHPDHYAIQAVLRGDADLFYRQEFALRQEVGFPPFGRLILLILEDTDRLRAEECARALADALDEAVRAAGVEVEIMGPHAAPHERRRLRHRVQILLKGPNAAKLGQLVKGATAGQRSSRRRDATRLIIDVDPLDFA
jgi:primosomal protein N' (replication factor Y)